MKTVYRLFVYFKHENMSPEFGLSIKTPWLSTPLDAVKYADRAINVRSPDRLGYDLEWADANDISHAYLATELWDNETNAISDSWDDDR